jgi:nucleoside-diphosphate-sugar epimerase
MVIGNGLIARAFSEYDKNDRYVIFASGVSDSSCVSEESFSKEIDMVESHFGTRSKFIYFSSTMLMEKETEYFLHKRKIEDLISKNIEDYIIFRLPNIIGKGGNCNNIFNLFKDKIKNGDRIVAIDSTRSMVDIEDLVRICEYCFHMSRETIVLSEIERIGVADLALAISREIGIEANIEKSSKKEHIITKNSPIIDMAIDRLGISREGYTKKTIKKYI